MFSWFGTNHFQIMNQMQLKLFFFYHCNRRIHSLPRSFKITLLYVPSIIIMLLFAVLNTQTLPHWDGMWSKHQIFPILLLYTADLTQLFGVAYISELSLIQGARHFSTYSTPQTGSCLYPARAGSATFISLGSFKLLRYPAYFMAVFHEVTFSDRNVHHLTNWSLYFKLPGQ